MSEYMMGESEKESGGGGREQDNEEGAGSKRQDLKGSEREGAVQECVSEFISFITGEASHKCQKEKRKTINGDDLLWAMTTLGFEDYVHPLNIYLHKYRELEGDKTAMLMVLLCHHPL